MRRLPRYKKVFALIVLHVCLLLPATRAQNHRYPPGNNNHRHSVKKAELHNYFTVYSGWSAMFNHNPAMDLFVSFPYQSTKHGNIEEIFSATKANVSPKNFCAYDMINFTFGLHRVFFDIGIGMATKLGAVSSDFNGGLRANFGTGINIPLTGLGSNTPRGEPFFYLKPSINIQYNSFEIALGSIDNNGTQVSALGVLSMPTFTYTAGSKYNRHTVTTYAQDLKITLQENYWMLVPKVSLATNPNRFILHLSLDVAYMMPFSSKEQLVFTQYDGHSASRESGRARFTSQGLTLTDNHTQVTSLPYSLKCFYLGFTVGANVSDIR